MGYLSQVSDKLYHYRYIHTTAPAIRKATPVTRSMGRSCHWPRGSRILLFRYTLHLALLRPRSLSVHDIRLPVQRKTAGSRTMHPGVTLAQRTACKASEARQVSFSSIRQQEQRCRSRHLEKKAFIARGMHYGDYCNVATLTDGLLTDHLATWPLHDCNTTGKENRGRALPPGVHAALAGTG